MKNLEDPVSIIRRGSKDWNYWRSQNFDKKIEINEVEFGKISLNSANFKNVIFRQVRFTETNLIGADFSSARLKDCSFDKVALSRSNFNRAEVIRCYFVQCNMSRSTLDHAVFTSSSFNDSDLSNCNLHRTDLDAADLNRVNFENADFRWANLFESKIIESNLCRAQLIGAFLAYTDFKNTNFQQADLSDANLSDASLRYANLSEACLRNTRCVDADLSYCDFRGALLVGTDFRQATLNFSNFRESSLWETVFSDVNLSNTQGLEECFHLGPSTIDHRTLALSRNLPESFLRGVGLPESRTYQKKYSSLMDKFIQRYSCFIIHAEHDEKFAKKVEEDIQNNDIRCWVTSPNFSDISSIWYFAKIRRIKIVLVLSENWAISQATREKVDNILEVESNFGDNILLLLSKDNLASLSQDTWIRLLKRSKNFFDFPDWEIEEIYENKFKELICRLKEMLS